MLKKRLKAHCGHFGLIQSEFAGLLSFKKPPVTQVDVVFSILDHDHNGRIDGLELLASLALCCHGRFEDKMRCTRRGAGAGARPGSASRTPAQSASSCATST